LVRIGGTFEDYLKKFPGKKRRYLMWEIRQLESHFAGRLQLVRITEPGEVDSFIQAAQQVAAQSWQAMHLEADKKKLLRNAEAGWLRCYLLVGGEQPLAYFVGRQSDGICIADDSAYDARLASFSPGKILWLKVIEELHALGTVSWLDFGSADIGYKQFWAHESYPESSILLMKSSMRNAVAFWPMMAVQWPTAVGRKLSVAMGSSGFYDRSLHRVSKLFRRKR
jgi:CelD/BcsL family acetyltransferase involved in cellulose biosynthesis